MRPTFTMRPNIPGLVNHASTSHAASGGITYTGQGTREQDALARRPTSSTSRRLRSTRSATSCARRSAGRWTADQAPAVERCVADLGAAVGDERRIIFDLSHVDRLDTLGAWVLDRTRHDLGASGHVGRFRRRARRAPHPAERGRLSRLPARSRGQAQLGLDRLPGRYRPERSSRAGTDFVGGVSFLGEVVVAHGPRRDAAAAASAGRRSCTSSSRSPSAACRSSC